MLLEFWWEEGNALETVAQSPKIVTSDFKHTQLSPLLKGNAIMTELISYKRVKIDQMNVVSTSGHAVEEKFARTLRTPRNLTFL